GFAGYFVLGDFIGTDVTGTRALGNVGFGIEIIDVEDAQIGDSSTNGRNIISANGAGGISIHGSNAFANSVDSDLIGTAADGVSPLGNGGPGVLLDGDARFNFIGSDRPGEGNTIAFNSGAGVLVQSGTRNLIQGNSIFANGALGINLNSATGANDLQ